MIARRHMVIGFGATLGLAAAARAVPAEVASQLVQINPAVAAPASLFQRALAAAAAHRAAFQSLDRIGIADFSQPSRLPRFHILDTATGALETVLVAHGRGSDPQHSGWLERFSNEPGSLATSAGAYLTGDTYEGRHGLSRRLIGLDPDNSNAEARAIVIHAADYVSTGLIATQGKLGRSEGCLAVSAADLSRIIDRLGPGRMIFADRVAS